MDVYLVDYKRTAFSRSRPREPEKDLFNSLRMDEVMAMLLNDIISRTRIDPKDIGDVITGCALQVGEDWLYGGRMPVLLAGLPPEVPAMGVDRQCSSSMAAIAMGAFEIVAGHSHAVIAGGMEHMTHVPMGDNPMIIYNRKLIEDPRYAKYDMTTGFSMGLTAEKLASLNNIGRR
ncbi:beta-ketoacyl synthase N-terminal-like domain-containing protein, partial [Thermoplasma sp.]|uniref:thiolase family protein n=1 Tax=Thermoplasma sp. TaxID=1973142 RepID=UPI0025DE780E